MFLAVACGDGGEREVSRQEVADAVTGFVGALAGADSEGLATYWSQTCVEPERSRQAGAASRLVALFGRVLGEGEYRLSVDAGALAIDVIDDEHVTVPLEQPPGAVIATYGAQPLPVDDNEAFLSEVPLNLIREDGRWRVATCTLFL